jgi:2'-5' RNA ligase
MSELIRSFVAVEVPGRVRQQISELLVVLRRQPLSSVRWVRPEQMHLTLAFLGEVTSDFITAVQGALVKAAPTIPGFAAQLGGLGAFPGLGRGRVVWAGMKMGKNELVALQREVTRVLVGVGYVPEARPFSPHLTLGRLREPANVAPVGQARFESEPFDVDRVVLFRSVLRPEGPVYTRLAEFPLAQ